MHAYFTVMPDGLVKIELSPDGGDDESQLRDLLRRGFYKHWFGGMGSFDGVEVILRPELGRTVVLGDKEMQFTCPSRPEEGPPSAGRRRDVSH
ncbi:MAG: hypothetical protein HYZ63_00495 [Candidatus Andersenbacteria bacterium]|nr:hypothetical protein [Candidatus Andersenbacteria bacterium]